MFQRKRINAIPVLSMEGEIEGIVSVSDLALEKDDQKLVSDIMTPKTYVVSIDSGLRDAARMMEKHKVHHLVAMDEGAVVGILSSMDFVSLYGQA